MGRIYFAYDTVDCMGYVGCSLGSMRDIKRGHEQAARKGVQTPFHRAIRKNGPEAFIWEQLQRSNNPYVLAHYEVEMIRILKTRRPNGYNVRRGGDSLPMQLPEARKRQSEVVAAAFTRPEVKANHHAAMNKRKGEKQSPETCAKKRANLLGKKHPPERVANNRAAQLIAQNKPEQKLKRNAAVKAAQNRPEWKAKQREAQREAQNRPEVVAKKRAAMLGKTPWNKGNHG